MAAARVTPGETLGLAAARISFGCLLELSFALFLTRRLESLQLTSPMETDVPWDSEQRNPKHWATKAGASLLDFLFSQDKFLEAYLNIGENEPHSPHFAELPFSPPPSWGSRPL